MPTETTDVTDVAVQPCLVCGQRTDHGSQLCSESCYHQADVRLRDARREYQELRRRVRLLSGQPRWRRVLHPGRARRLSDASSRLEQLARDNGELLEALGKRAQRWK